MARATWLGLGLGLLALSGTAGAVPVEQALKVAPNHRYLATADGQPFFWLGDTGWLLLGRLDRDETERYLSKRAAQGFNVIQVMVLHTAAQTNRYAAPALTAGNPAQPRTTVGSDPNRPGEYDYWDHLDWVIDRAAAHGLYVALVPIWGTIVVDSKLPPDRAATYGKFLGERYRDKPNIVWMNGGDTPGEQNVATWNALGNAIKAADPGHLMTFHPFGRTDSSWNYHRAPWLDFNMFQSGHKSYAQEEKDARAEDNWRYVEEDLALTPLKPTIDGEPSYENIPHGLHDLDAPRWQAADVRRYAWWAVFAGAFGHSYGDNDVMQMFVPGRDKPAYAANVRWDQALDAEGAGQNGVRYDRVIATRGKAYAMAYSYTGRPFRMRLGVIAGRKVRATWFDPRTGEQTAIGRFANRGERLFTPPGTPRPGNDWVLLLDGE